MSRSSIPSKLSLVRKDLVAIGPMAPIRAVYEVAKRSGAHGALLRNFVQRAPERKLVAIPAFQAPATVSAAARSRTLADAAQIITEGHRVFGGRFPVTRAADWNSLPGTDRCWPAHAFWWDIDIRTDQRIGDVKWTWELGRHRDLVILARAGHLEPDGPWLSALENRLGWWFEASPSEIGIHWYSNLEIALRVIAWIQIHALVGNRIAPRLTALMATQVNQAERHLLFDFPYTASSMRNNHLLGDALGLIAVDRFTGGDGSRRSARIAESFFTSQLQRHMHPDGSMIEDSLSYHRFVMEMLIVKVMLGDSSSATRQALGGAAQHLARLGALDQGLPQWGDWDEGRVLASSGDPLDVAGSTALAMAIAGCPMRDDLAGAFDEQIWYDAGTARDRTPWEAPAAGGTGLPSGGITHLRRGDWSVWFKAGIQPSHQHADLTHVSIKHRDAWIVVDPGTGTYNGPLEIRNAFRTSKAHNGALVEGAPTLTPHRAFRWLGDPSASGSPVLDVAGVKVALGVHDAFVDTHDCRVARVVLANDDGVVCVDWLERPLDTTVTVALAPDVASMDGHLTTENGSHFVFGGMTDARDVRGEEAPFAGWHSATYGTWTPTTWVTVQRPASRIGWWAVTVPEACEITVTEDSVRIGALTLTAVFAVRAVELVVTSSDGDYVLRVPSEAS